MTGSRPRVISSDAFARALESAGVIREGDFISRLVIVAQAGKPVMLYLERLGDERLLGVAMTLAGIDITVTAREMADEGAAVPSRT